MLSLFGGLGLLDEAFRLEGFTVVRGPDLLWSQDVRDFHPPSGVFGGVIGGPPCQPFSRLRHMVEANGYAPRHANLIPEYERVVMEAAPEWFVMEEVTAAPLPEVAGYVVRPYVLNNRHFGGEQNRVRRVSFGTRNGRGLALEPSLFDAPVWESVVAGDARRTPVAMVRGGRKSNADLPPRTLADMLRLQGLLEDWLAESPFTDTAKRQMIGNGVPLPLGRAVARAVSRAMQQTEAAS